MKRIIYTLTCLLLTISAWAQNVAKIGDTEYETLKSALDVATNGETVVLISDVTTGVSVSATTNAKLDFNGHKITASSIGLQNYGTLELMDSQGTGGVDAKYAIRVENNSNTTIKSGSYSSVEGAVTLHKSVGATVTIDGGTFSASDNAVISSNGTDRSGSVNTVIINDGIFNGSIVTAGYVACGIYSPWKDEFVVNGGTFNIENGCGVLARAGSVTINGGTFNTTGTATGKVGDSRVVVPCAAVVYDSQAGYPAQTVESKIEVPSTSTASFTSEVSAVAIVGDSHISISGGTYSSELSEDVCAEDFKLQANGDGTYGVVERVYVAQIGEQKYESLAEAISAAQNEETVTLLADVTDNITIPAGKNITLDLNGKTLSGGSVASNGKKAAIVNNGTIIIQDSSAEQTGTIKREDDDTDLSASNSYYVIDNQGTMTIKSGTITNNAGLTTSHKGSSLIRNGEPNTAVLNIEGGTITQDNFDVIKNGGNGTLNITGGTINSANSYAVLSYSEMNMSAGTINGKVCLRSYTDKDEDTHGVGNITGGTINGNITVEVYKGNTPNTLSECNISGDAVINGTLSVGEGNGNEFVANDDKGTIAVSGGTFANSVPEQYCADGFIPTDDGEGHYGVKNGSYVAQNGDVKYESLSDAIAAAENGATITLIADINEAVTNTNTNNFTINLNGKNWISSGDAFKNNGGTVTFTGEGLVKSTAADGIAVWARTGSIIINGGNFENCSNEESTVYVGTTDANLAGKQPTITINGGSFKNTAEGVYKWNTSLLPLTLNIINNIATADTYQAIVVNGGIFFGNDPSVGDDSQLNKINNNSNFVNSEKHAEYKDGVFTIEEGGYKAQTGYIKYVTLDDAIDAAPESATTITLLANAETTKETLPANVTIDANGNELTMPSFVVLDGQAFTLPNITGAETYKVKKATYIRTNISATQWGTVCLPFSLTSGNGADYYTYNNISGSTLTVDKTTSTVAPNTPVVFKKAKGSDLKIEETDATVSLVTPETLENGALVGTYEDVNKPADGSIYFINSDTFHKAQVSLTVPAYRAYINNTAPAGGEAAPRTLYIVVSGDDVTAIGTLTTDDAAVSAIYDATGRKISAPQKGINIMKLENGKTVKVMIK